MLNCIPYPRNLSNNIAYGHTRYVSNTHTKYIVSLFCFFVFFLKSMCEMAYFNFTPAKNYSNVNYYLPLASNRMFTCKSLGSNLIRSSINFYFV